MKIKFNIYVLIIFISIISIMFYNKFYRYKYYERAHLSDPEIRKDNITGAFEERINTNWRKIK